MLQSLDALYLASDCVVTIIPYRVICAKCRLYAQVQEFEHINGSYSILPEELGLDKKNAEATADGAASSEDKDKKPSVDENKDKDAAPKDKEGSEVLFPVFAYISLHDEPGVKSDF